MRLVICNNRAHPTSSVRPSIIPMIGPPMTSALLFLFDFLMQRFRSRLPHFCFDLIIVRIRTKVNALPVCPSFSPQQFSRKQILPCCAEIRNVFLHFGQNNGKFCKMVSSRICVLVFPRHSGHKIHICTASVAIFPPNLSLIPALSFLLIEFLLNLLFL